LSSWREGGKWKDEALNTVNPSEVIQRIPILKTCVEDKPWWKGKELEKISVKHVYNSLKDRMLEIANTLWSWIWKLEVQVKGSSLGMEGLVA